MTSMVAGTVRPAAALVRLLQPVSEARFWRLPRSTAVALLILACLAPVATAHSIQRTDSRSMLMCTRMHGLTPR